jgi:antitoxin ParD1/3/4
MAGRRSNDGGPRQGYRIAVVAAAVPTANRPDTQTGIAGPLSLRFASMNSITISLPDALKSFVDEQVVQRGYGTCSEYVCELIRQDADRLRLRGLLLEGGASGRAAPADAAYFDALRERWRRR